MTMPAQKPGVSRQDYATPPSFLTATKRFLQISEFSIDLAAAAHNTAAKRFYSVADNALEQPWTSDGWAWLNPPFAQIGPWAARAWQQAQLGAQIAMLVPAGVGANWWRDYVHQKAWVLLLNGRITFVGETMPYVKDCCLLLYGPTVKAGYSVWSWNRRSTKASSRSGGTSTETGRSIRSSEVDAGCGEAKLEQTATVAP